MSTVLDNIRDNLDRNFPRQRTVSESSVPNFRNTTKFGTGQAALSTSPAQLAGPRPGRSCFKVTNTSDSVDVYIGNSASVSVLNGDLLPAGKGQWVSYPTASAMWAVVSSGTPTVTWSEVYDQP
jgi:hypothetical protein